MQLPEACPRSCGSRREEDCIEFGAWESKVNATLADLLGSANVSRTALASGLVIWRMSGGGSVTVGLEDHSGLVYSSFSDDEPAMMFALDAETESAARYIATRLSAN